LLPTGESVVFNNNRIKLTVAALVVSVVTGCSADTVLGRWYTQDQVAQGNVLFSNHCASCHGDSAEGTLEWRTTDADGNYPPPPLDGSAHAWHHPLSTLKQTIEFGGARFGGVMPGFAGTLSEDEAQATIAYFQSFWSDDVYARWQKNNNR